MDDVERNKSMSESQRLQLIDLIQRISEEKFPLFVCTETDR
jgi:hypothetical protein